MNDDRTRDEALAAYTDAILAGEDPTPPADDPELAPMVQRLQRVVAAETPPPADMRRRIRQDVAALYDESQRARRVVRRRWTQTARLAGAAAAVMVLVAVALVAPGDEVNVPGTASGDDSDGFGLWLLAGGAVAALVAFYVYTRLRRPR